MILWFLRTKERKIRRGEEGRRGKNKGELNEDERGMERNRKETGRKEGIDRRTQREAEKE